MGVPEEKRNRHRIPPKKNRIDTPDSPMRFDPVHPILTRIGIDVARGVAVADDALGGIHELFFEETGLELLIPLRIARRLVRPGCDPARTVAPGDFESVCQAGGV